MITSFGLYLLIIAVTNLIWETIQLPLYTLWNDGSAGEIVFAVAHCTAGDILIAFSALAIAAIVFSRGHWPHEKYWPVAGFAVLGGIVYTAYSEWVNTHVEESWTYSTLMPTISPLEIGLSPLLQWIVLPPIAFVVVKRRLKTQH